MVDERDGVARFRNEVAVVGVGTKDEVPYPIAVIELEDGLRILSNLVGVENEDIRIGQAVEVVFDDVTPEITLPKFRPVFVTYAFTSGNTCTCGAAARFHTITLRSSSMTMVPSCLMPR